MGYAAQSPRVTKINPMLLSDRQLKYELAVCDAQMRESVEWGSLMSEAEQRYHELTAETKRRRAA